MAPLREFLWSPTRYLVVGGKIYVYRMDSFNVDVFDVGKETWSEEGGPELRTKYLDFFFC